MPSFQLPIQPVVSQLVFELVDELMVRDRWAAVQVQLLMQVAPLKQVDHVAQQLGAQAQSIMLLASVKLADHVSQWTAPTAGLDQPEVHMAAVLHLQTSTNRDRMHCGRLTELANAKREELAEREDPAMAVVEVQHGAGVHECPRLGAAVRKI